MKSCFNDARQRAIGISTAWEQIGRRGVDLQIAYARLTSTFGRVQQLAQEGRSALARERTRTLPSAAHHYWLDEGARAFAQDMAIAKRITFLAAQATEFDTQQSVGVRLGIVRARHPQQLREALDGLKRVQQARTINGGRPQELTLGLSLRDQILGLRFNKETGAEYTTEEANLRLRERLRAPEAAIFDSDGRYVGQGVRFTLTPRTETSGRCAERLWSVAASVVGEGLSTSQPRGRVFLFKQNTAQSQWCRGLGGGAPAQVGRPQMRGFLYGLATDAVSTEREASSSFAGAELQPWFNQSRTELLKSPQPPQGSTDELAGRGLYGDYLLVFPYAGMLDDAGTFNLEGLEDVILRVDYLSVNNVQISL